MAYLKSIMAYSCAKCEAEFTFIVHFQYVALWSDWVMIAGGNSLFGFPHLQVYINSAVMLM